MSCDFEDFRQFLPRPSYNSGMNGVPLLIKTKKITDSRGSFNKIFSQAIVQTHLILSNIAEIFTTCSSIYTIRGMHFQRKPHEIGKLVWVSNGSILDYVIDIRDQPSFGEVYKFELSSNNGGCLWIPPGFAHGFQSLDNNTIVNYATDGSYNLESDTGIHWDSFGGNWVKPPKQISTRDSNFLTLSEYREKFTSK